MQKHQRTNIVVLQTLQSSWPKMLGLFFFAGLNSSTHAVQAISDRSLSQHRLNDQSISTEVMQQVQQQTHDPVLMSLEQQRAQHNQAQLNIAQIESSVLTPKQQQKKLEDQLPPVVEMQPRIEPKLKIVNYGVSAQNNTVHILTEDKITIYLNPQAH